MNSNEDIGHRDKLEVGLLGVREINLGFPDGLDQVRVRQIKWCIDILMGKAGVKPLLPQVGVGHIVLESNGNGIGE